MDLAIRKIILWPVASGLEPRVINFEPATVNVITGQSGTGKSALIAIVDYTLGSDKCAIPVGLIRETVSWFGVLLQTGKRFVLAARRNPGDQAGTGDMFLRDGDEDSIPRVIQKNYNLTEAKAYFDRLAGLPQHEFPDSEYQAFRDRPSFRDMAAFEFQPQHIVANPYTLFFKADTTEHREKLKAVLPFVLGVVTAQQLGQMRRLRDLERELATYEKEFALRQDTIKRLYQDVQPLFFRARELGLIPLSAASQAKWNLTDYLRELGEAVKRAASHSPAGLQTGSTEGAVRELLQLRELEEKSSTEIARRRAKLTRMEHLRAAAVTYGDDLARHSVRLEHIDWFQRQITKTAGCPVCGSETDSAERQVTDLKLLAEEVSKTSARLQSAPQVLDREIEQTLVELRGHEREMDGIRKRLRVLEDESDSVAQTRQTLAEVHRFAGYVAQVLDSYQAVSGESDLTQKIAALQTEIASLRRDTSADAQRSRLEAATTDIASKMAHYAEILELERGGDKTGLSTTELTVTVESQKGRRDYLWEIGSGANWVGYHLAALFALHERFLQHKDSPVPSFMMIDQPSQVYFPERLTESATKGAPPSVDIVALQRIFRAMVEAVRRTKGGLQIIVTDHAGDYAWKGLDVNVVEEWRQGKGDFLIPESWKVADNQTPPQ